MGRSRRTSVFLSEEAFPLAAAAPAAPAVQPRVTESFRKGKGKGKATKTTTTKAPTSSAKARKAAAALLAALEAAVTPPPDTELVTSLRQRWAARVQCQQQALDVPLEALHEVEQVRATLLASQEAPAVTENILLQNEVTDDQRRLMEARIAEKKRQFEAFERRERAHTAERVRAIYPHLTSFEAQLALKHCNNNADDVMERLSDREFLLSLRKEIALEAEKQLRHFVLSEQERMKRERQRERRNQVKAIKRKGEKAKEGAYSRSRLRLDDALEKIDTFEGWSPARIRAWKTRDQNPNAYYYRFNAPGEKQANGPWRPEEIRIFMTELAKLPDGRANGRWGEFSRAIPGRVGYQCSNFYRLLIKESKIFDPNYVKDDKGRIHYLFGKDKRIIKHGVRMRKKKGDPVDSASAAASNPGTTTTVATATTPAAASLASATITAASPASLASAAVSAASNVLLTATSSAAAAAASLLSKSEPYMQTVVPTAATDAGKLAVAKQQPQQENALCSVQGRKAANATAAAVAVGVAATKVTKSPAKKRARSTSATGKKTEPAAKKAKVSASKATATTKRSRSTSTSRSKASASAASGVDKPASKQQQQRKKRTTTRRKPSACTTTAAAVAAAAAAKGNAPAGNTADASAAPAQAEATTTTAAATKKRRRRQRFGAVDSDSDNWGGDDGDDDDDFYLPAKTKRARRRAVAAEEAAREAIVADNPLPGMIDPITLQEVEQPAISPWGHVMDYKTWSQCLTCGTVKNVCPITKNPLSKRDLVILTKDNVDEYRDRMITTL